MLELCRRSNSDCLVAPCCNGKMHQHFLESDKVESSSLEKESVSKNGAHLDEPNQHELEKKTNEEIGTRGSREREGDENECLNFYPRSKLFSSLLSR